MLETCTVHVQTQKYADLFLTFKAHSPGRCSACVPKAYVVIMNNISNLSPFS